MTLSSLALSKCYGESFCEFRVEKLPANANCLFIFVRSLIFTSITLCRYWTFIDTNVVIDNIASESLPHNSSENDTISCHAHDLLFIKTYLIGVNGIVALNVPILLLMIYNSAQGSITDTKARHYVTPLLYLK
jgi:hypothetical protein